MYENYIANDQEVLVLMDAEIYQRDLFFELFQRYLTNMKRHGGLLIFDGSNSESIQGDYRPRNFLFIFKWQSIEVFNRWWNSSENYRFKQMISEFADIKATTIQQNKKNNKWLTVIDE